MVDQFATLTPGSDPVGSAVGGFNQGLGIVEALRKRKRDLVMANQQDVKTYVDLVNAVGADKAASVASELGMDHTQLMQQAMAGMGSAEERAKLTIPQATALGFPAAVGGMSPSTMQGAGAMLRGQAAKSQAQTAWDALMRGDTKGMNDAADKANANATALQTHAMTAFFATPEEKAAAVAQANEAMQEGRKYRSLALLMTKRGGALTMKEIQGQGFLMPQAGQPTTPPAKPPRQPNESWEAYKARTGG